MADRNEKAASVRTVRPKWGRAAVLICGKCVKRHATGKAVRRALKEATVRHAGAAGARKPRLIKVGCLGLCPKGALVAASAATLSEGELLLVRDAPEAEVAAERLCPPTPPHS